jgi:PAS domain-containing protein
VVNRIVVGSLSFFGNQMAKKRFRTNKSNSERQTVDPLAESEARYRRLVEAVVDYAIFQLDASGRITSWNPGAQKIKGYEQSEIIGKHLELPARGSVDRNVSVLLKWPRTVGIGSRVSFAIDNAFIRM